MITVYHAKDGRLIATETPDHAALTSAVWIDLYQPDMAIAITLAGLGLDVPSLEDMEEIELSNRLYHDDGTDYLTVMVPGQNDADEQVTAPITFILSSKRLVTVRHHRPRPFDTFPARAEKSGLGVDSPDHVFTGLVQEIIGRLADHLEGVGRALDEVARWRGAAGWCSSLAAATLAAFTPSTMPESWPSSTGWPETASCICRSASRGSRPR